MSKSLKEQITKLAATQIKTASGETYAEALKHEVDRLYDCIQREIERFYDSYTPSEKGYKRTYRLLGALYAENLVDIRVVGTQIQLSIRFHPDLAYHRNFSDDHDSYIPILMNYGYVAEELEKSKCFIPYLTRRKGFFFIENGIMNWNKTNKLGLTIDVTAIYEGREFSLF